MIRKIPTEEAIARVLTTPLGARVMRPEFGSRLFELVDRTYDSGYKLDAVEWTVDAIEKNLPELAVRRVDVEDGAVVMQVEDENGNLEVRVEFAT